MSRLHQEQVINGRITHVWCVARDEDMSRRMAEFAVKLAERFAFHEIVYYDRGDRVDVKMRFELKDGTFWSCSGSINLSTLYAEPSSWPATVSAIEERMYPAFEELAGKLRAQWTQEGDAHGI